jgi:clan AA aspartic protease
MVITQVTAAVRNPAHPKKSWEALFLVDTGAIDCLVPGRHLRALGLRPKGSRVYQLADGSEVTLDVTVAEVEFMGVTVGATVIYGPDDAEPILGVTALESVGIEVDPRDEYQVASHALPGTAPSDDAEDDPRQPEDPSRRCRRAAVWRPPVDLPPMALPSRWRDPTETPRHPTARRIP